jgi:hypothetical protein
MRLIYPFKLLRVYVLYFTSMRNENSKFNIEYKILILNIGEWYIDHYQAIWLKMIKFHRKSFLS